MFDFLRASDEIIHQRYQLAKEVRDSLNYAGLLAHISNDAEREFSSAEVEIDGAADEMGGVYVNWRTSQKLSEMVVECTSSGRHAAPEVVLFQSVSKFMRDAIAGVLQQSGFAVELINDDMRPPAVRVLASRGNRADRLN